MIELKICGICGSDVSNILEKSCMPTDKIGHEISGIVSDIGSDINEFKIGDRVIVHHHCPCEKCYYCKHGNQTMCLDFKNKIVPNGFSEKILVPEWIIKNGGVIKINEKISFQEGALIEPLACCIRAWNKLKFKTNDSIAIFGFGPIGAMHSLLAQHNNFKKIFCIDIDKYRLDFCKSHNMGEPLRYTDVSLQDSISKKTKGIGVDIIIIATSDLSTFNQALKVIRKGGIILIFGEPEKNYKLNMDMNLVYSKEITICTTYAASNEEMKKAIKLVENGNINLKKLITHEFPLEKIKDAFDFSINGRGKMKIVLKHK